MQEQIPNDNQLFNNELVMEWRIRLFSGVSVSLWLFGFVPTKNSKK